MEVTDIVIKFIEENGFDGLYNYDLGCGCGKDEYFSCGELQMECCAAYRHESPDTCPKDCDLNCFSNKDYDSYYCGKKAIKGNKELNNAE